MSATPLTRAFYDRDAVDVAPDLLNKVLVHGNRSGRIVEVEAYDGDNDPASHAYRRQTPRNAVMYGPPGHLYVYLSYGMHHCCNVVCREEGRAAAVLIRALEPLSGLEEMRERRIKAGLSDHHLASGPGKLCQALGIQISHNGAELISGDRGITVVDDGVTPPVHPAIGTRIGISAGKDYPWRWWIEGNRHVSRGHARPA